MRVVSLFAGIGGFDLGFQRAGFEIVAHVEKDANCRKLLAAKWPDAVALDDVCTTGKHNLPACDVVTFGFPCQDLSVAGKHSGLSGGRSKLFYEATRIIRELQPAWALFENVPGLLSSGRGRDFGLVLNEMAKCGYCGAWRILDAQWFGVAQRRRRVFGLFTRLDSGAERAAEVLSIAESLRGHSPPSREAGEGIAHDVAPCIGASGRGFERAGETRGQDPVVAFDVPTVAGCLQERDAKGVDSDTKPGHLIPTSMAVRRLTPTECERLQGFPDGWTAGFSDSARYRMLGNAVCQTVSYWIARRLASQFILDRDTSTSQPGASAPPPPDCNHDHTATLSI
jgi:DNA (cytosine-5)-methyltransferase 1